MTEWGNSFQGALGRGCLLNELVLPDPRGRKISKSDADQANVAAIGEAGVNLQVSTERSHEATQGRNHVILALLDPRDLPLREPGGFRKVGLGDAELLSKRLKIQLDDLLLDPICIRRLGLGSQRALSLHFRPSLQFSTSHGFPPRSRPGTLSVSARLWERTPGRNGRWKRRSCRLR